MKKSLHLLITLITLFILNGTSMKATHIMGGELTYNWLGSNDYELRMTLYRDCSGIAAPGTVSVNISSTSCAIAPYTVVLNPVPGSPTQIATVCSGIQTTCNGGTALGVDKWEYSATVTLGANCTDYIFSYTECCRNASITNLVNPSSNAAQFNASLNNLNVSFNSSPRFANDPIVVLETGHLATINNGAFDPDGDSLSVTLSPALNSSGTAISYAPPLTYLNPMNSSTPLVVDPATGDLSVTPNTAEVDVVVYTVNEYRNGVLIGSTNRDIQIHVVPGTNQLPELSGVNGTNAYTANACAGNNIQFMVYSTDLDLDSTSISWSAPGIPAISVTTFGAANDSALVELITDSTMINSAAYLLDMSVNDNNCPYSGLQSYTYQLYVNGCGTDVWPGDANSDLTCDLYDVLPIGLGFSSTGPVRPAATTNWVAEPSTNWSQDFISGVNYKHADCNGDGTIDAADTLAISLNYGQTHPVRLSNPNLLASGYSMSLVASQDSAGPADTFSISVQLGSSNHQVDPIYGIAFNLNFNPILVDSALSSFHFVPTALGTPGTDLLTFARTDWVAGQISAVAVRTDQINAVSDTTIALFDVVIIDNVSARAYSRFTLTDIRGVTVDGLLHSFTAINDSVNVNTTSVGIQKNKEKLSVSIYPNPAKDEMIIVSNNTTQGNIFFYDLNGRIAMEINGSSLNRRIDISKLSKGIYSVGIYTDNGVIFKKLVVSR